VSSARQQDIGGASSADSYRVYGYRWVVLAAVMLVNLTIQMLWIAFAPITSLASGYYGVSELAIGFLAMSFMIVFVIMSLPAAWVIDTKGFRIAIGFGSVLAAAGGLARGLAGDSYTLVLLATIAIAVAQPFLLNAWTKVPAYWFDKRQRATAVGLTTLASMLGIAVGMALTAPLADALSIPTVQLVYGLLAAAAAVFFLVAARERPATPPGPPGEDERALMLDGLKHALRVKPFLVMLLVAFIVMSTFNGVTTWVEQIIKPRGFSPTEAGTMGALMLVAGVIGAVVLSALSDRKGQRVRYMVIALVAAIPGVLGVTFASSAMLLYAFAALLGFFLVAVLPIGMQYAAEIASPTPEGTSTGLIQLCGQVSVVSVYIMAAMRLSDGSFTVSLVLAAALLAVMAFVLSRLRDARPATLTSAAIGAQPAAGGHPETAAGGQPAAAAGQAGALPTAGD
jgi:cyanate permease